MSKEREDMSLPNVNDEMMKRYLLGDLSEEDQIRLQESFLRDKECFEQLKLVEDDLIDEYVHNQLSRDDRERFETYYLVTNGRREKVEFVQDLVKALALPWRRAAWLFLRSQWQSFWEARTAIRKPALVLAWGGLAVIALFLAAQTIRLRSDFRRLSAAHSILSQREQDLQAQTQQERNRNNELAESLSRAKDQLSELESKLSQLSASRLAAVSFVLASGFLQSRGEGGDVKQLIIPAGISLAHLQLNFESTTEYQRYRMSLKTGSGEVWSQDSLPVRIKGAEKAIVIDLPAAVLRADDYVITLSGVNRDGSMTTVENYSFRVLIK